MSVVTLDGRAFPSVINVRVDGRLRRYVPCDAGPGESGHESGQNPDSVQIESPAVQKATECDCDTPVKCVAEVKVDGEQLEKLVHEAAVEYAGVDREALLALAEDVEESAAMATAMDASKGSKLLAELLLDIARRIREALGEVAE